MRLRVALVVRKQDHSDLLSKEIFGSDYLQTRKCLICQNYLSTISERELILSGDRIAQDLHLAVDIAIETSSFDSSKLCN